MGTVFQGLALSIAVCMIHAAITRNTRLLQGGVPLLALFVLLSLPSIFS